MLSGPDGKALGLHPWIDTVRFCERAPILTWRFIMVWFIVVSVLLSDGTFVQQAKFINAVSMQNREACVALATEKANEALIEFTVKDSGAKTWGLCSSIEKDKMLNIINGPKL